MNVLSRLGRYESSPLRRGRRSGFVAVVDQDLLPSLDRPQSQEGTDVAEPSFDANQMFLTIQPFPNEIIICLGWVTRTNSELLSLKLWLTRILRFHFLQTIWMQNF